MSPHEPLVGRLKRGWGRWAVAAAVAALFLSMVPVAASATERIGQVGPVAVERTAGADRVETAVRVSEAHFETAATAVLARADEPVDALAGVPLGARLRAPLLLVPRDDVPMSVIQELHRLGVTDAVLLGGPAAVSGEVETRLAREFRVQRISGGDRIDTAAAIARHWPDPPNSASSSRRPRLPTRWRPGRWPGDWAIRCC